MASTKINYTHFDTTNPILKKIRDFENRNIFLTPEVYVKFNPGDRVLPQTFNEYYTSIQTFPVENTDFWLVTMPKAGTAWAQEMVWLLANNCSFEGAKMPLNIRFPYLELDAVYRPQMQAQKQYIDVISSFDVAKNMNPRFLKTHLPYSLLPKKIRNGEKTPWIIYVARHPKDVIVSFYHHEVLFHGYKGTLDDMVEQYTADMTVYAPYWTHVREYWERRHESNILFIKYEDMQRDLKQVIQRVSSFLKVEAPEESLLSSILEHLSFESMKKNPFVNKDKATESLVNAQGQVRKSHYIRKGKSGGYREELSDASVERVDTWIAMNRIEGLYEKDVELI